MSRLGFLFTLSLVFMVACRPEVKKAEPVVPNWDLLDAQNAAQWQQAGIPDEGKIDLTNGELTLHAGEPMTGARWDGWTKSMPETNYTIEYEAMKLEGDDIFGMVTFPVGSHQSHATFVLGGWGGTVTGISSIDFQDANENQTRAEQRFEKGRWYQVKVEVREDEIKVWINDRLVANTYIKGRKVTLRPGFVDHCIPFGFATYGTTGKVRFVKVKVTDK